MGLKVGSKGDAVKAWQKFLYERGYISVDGAQLVTDGDFGRNTAFATCAFQKDCFVTAELDELTLSAANSMGFGTSLSNAGAPSIPFIQAKNYREANRTKIDFIVIHDMEAPEVKGVARNIANWFANQKDGEGPSSAHYCVDRDEVIQCVLNKDIAYHAPPNTNSIGIEHAGYAKQGPRDWLDEYSLAMLKLSAALVKNLCKQYSIPIVRLSSADLLAGKRGICAHSDVSSAWKKSAHTDVGPNFCWPEYLAMILSS